MEHTGISVIVPTCNRPHLLATTLRSVLAQRDVEIEVIVVDDGAEQPAAAIVEAAGDARVRLVRNDGRHGECGTRNRGLTEVRREWVAFCDDDDLWAPDKLRSQLNAATSDGSAWAYAGDVIVDMHLRVLAGGPPPPANHLLAGLQRRNVMPAGSSNVLVRRDALTRAGSFDPDLHRAGDWDMWLRLGRIAGSPACVCRPLLAYRFHPTNITDGLDEMIDEPKRLAVRYGIAVDIAAMHRRAAWTALRAGRRTAAIRHYACAVRRGDVRSVARMVFAAFDPRVGSDRMFALLRRDPEWVAEAEGWLSPFVALHAVPSGAVATGGRA